MNTNEYWRPISYTKRFFVLLLIFACSMVLPILAGLIENDFHYNYSMMEDALIGGLIIASIIALIMHSKLNTGINLLLNLAVNVFRGLVGTCAMTLLDSMYGAILGLVVIALAFGIFGFAFLAYVVFGAALFVVDLIISFFLFLAERGNNDLTELEEGVKSLRMILAIVVTVVVIVIEFQ